MVSVVKKCLKAFLRNDAPLGYCFTISPMLKHACVTLHLPPPLTFTLLKSLPVFSSMITCICGCIRAAFTAQKKTCCTAANYNKFFFFHFILCKISILFANCQLFYPLLGVKFTFAFSADSISSNEVRISGPALVI